MKKQGEGEGTMLVKQFPSSQNPFARNRAG